MTFAGSTNLDIYDPSELVKRGEGIIYVGMQYRTNMFGFLYMDNYEAPGNMGLLDQVY